MKIFLDDIREVSEELGYKVVRDYDSCIVWIRASRNILEFVSLDYSLGSDKTGYDVLVYMVENNIYPKHINIHSDHPEGVPKMKKYVEEYFPKTTSLSFNRV